MGAVTPIAFDIRRSWVDVVQIRKGRTGIFIHHMARHPVDPGSTTRERPFHHLTPLLKAILKERRFRGRQAMVHMPGDQVLSFPVAFQVNRGESLEHALVKEAGKHLPYPLEEAVIDYPCLVSDPPGNGHRATVVAARQKEILELFQIFKGCGFLSTAVDFAPLSLIRLHHFLFPATTGPAIVCHIGQGDSSIQVVSQDRILALRRFTWGLRHLVTKLNTSLAFTGEGQKALNLIKEHGLAHYQVEEEGFPSPPRGAEDMKTDRIVARMIAPGIEELVHEFHKIIGYTRNQEQIHAFETIYFYGHASQILGLAAYIKKRLNIKGTLVHPEDKIGFLPATGKALYQQTPADHALGLCLRAFQDRQQVI
ncbi:MAG: pilus assembly protein PilM [Desulfobacterium sp.]|nr:pilus assembly protein PilM [Desulfobacterium sp.]